MKWNDKSLVSWFNIKYVQTVCPLLAPSGLGKTLRNSQNIRAHCMRGKFKTRNFFLFCYYLMLYFPCQGKISEF